MGHFPGGWIYSFDHIHHSQDRRKKISEADAIQKALFGRAFLFTHLLIRMESKRLPGIIIAD